jgi:hypothetical protein
VAGTYSMMKSNSQSSFQSNGSYSRPHNDSGEEKPQYMKDFNLELKDTSRSNNHTATFVDEKENQDYNMLSLPVHLLQNNKLSELSITSGLPQNLLNANYD